MPKIVIREFDNTTAASAAYANFAVVVPGFYSATDDEDKQTGAHAFDENGVFECHNRAEFKTKIGLTSSKEHIVAEAKAPKRADDWKDGPRKLTSTEFDTYVDSEKLYVATANTAGRIGRLKDLEYEYSLADSGAKDSYAFNEETGPDLEGATSFMMLVDEGYDEITEAHLGNQIAYELLGLGYTVLYKKLDNTTYLEDPAFWAPLKDKTLYDFRYIISGLLSGNNVIYSNMVNLAKFDPENKEFDNVDPLSDGRGDCIALLDIDEDVYQGASQLNAVNAILNFAKNNIPTTKYAAVFAPTVTYAKGGLSEIAAFGNNRVFPASFHYLACAARSSEKFSEWYANAGYTRGISKYTVDSVGCKFGEAAVNMFQKRAKDSAGNIIMAINPIIQLRGSYYLWGNRTTEALGTVGTDDGDLKASHFLNIRQLCCTLKKQVYVACRQFTFDPNSDVLWINFCNSINPLLEKMKADQGIADYKILKVKTPRKAFLSAVLRIVPIEAVEDFDISIYLEDSLNGVIATAEE